MLYSTILDTSTELSNLRLYKAADRAIAFVDGKKALTAFDRELEEGHEVGPFYGKNMKLDILVENMGRVNYGPMLNWQRKGNRRLCVYQQPVFSAQLESSIRCLWIIWNSWIIARDMKKEFRHFIVLNLKRKRLVILFLILRAGEKDL